MASLFICVSVGLITKRLRNRARPTTTWLGGIAWRPRAFLVSDSTITMRVKLVIIIKMAGATVSSVSATMIVMLWLGLLIVSPRFRLTEAEPGAAGAGTVTAGEGVGAAGTADAGLLPKKNVAATMARPSTTSFNFDKTAPVGAAETATTFG